MSRKKYRGVVDSSSVLPLFFDFYVLNEVWFKTIGLAEYGYPVTKILPARKEEVIDTTFREKVALLKQEVLTALEYSVRREIRHFRNNTVTDYYATKLEEMGPSARRRQEVLNKFGLRKNSNFSKLPLEQIMELFNTKCWYVDFGGALWGTGTEYLIKLKNSKTIKDDIFLLDRIFDLQHNTGHLLNKTNFACLSERRTFKNPSTKTRRNIQPLNFRFKAGIDEMVHACSIWVQKIYRANLNYV